jgi:hypothetical protein
MNWQITKVLTITLITWVIVSCTESKKEEASKKDCSSINDKKVLLEIANGIIAKHDNPEIWNLTDPDTTFFFSTENYFTNSKTKTTLVLLGGNAGLSSGSADRLLMLFSCTDTLNLLWSGQIGPITESDIIDVNGDGIVEIIYTSNDIWMGECGDQFYILNFKEGKQNTIFQALSMSLIDCGLDISEKNIVVGDTLENTFNCSLEKLNDREYSIKQIRTTKIHNGGNTEEEIIKKAITTIDTVNFSMKNH